MRWVPVALLAVAVTACSKPPAPKVDAAAERSAATERSKQDVFGTQVKALENAKGLGADVDRKAQDNLDKVDAMSK
jgi:hypothetical protein